jgi:pyruvate,water dikinase
MSAPVRWFGELSLADRARVGGKGASLGELERAGIRVPPGFVVTTAAFEQFLAALDPRGAIRAQMERLDPANTAAIAQAAAQVRGRIESFELPSELGAEIARAYATLCAHSGDVPVAVRSSATAEDSDEASFAGLQDTYLWVCGAAAVISALRRCWASLYGEPSVSYRRRLRLPERHVAMGVVVQRMVRARSAGVVFTRSPTTGDRSVLALEASWGLGSAMVSGEVTPDRYVVNKVTLEIVQRTVSAKSVRHVPLAGGGVRAEPVPAHEQALACLADAELLELARLAKLVERHYGKPQDIEWAIDEGGCFPENVFLLQSRPETVWANRETAPLARPRASAVDHVLARLSGGPLRR